MEWQVVIHKRVRMNLRKIPKSVHEIFNRLVIELQNSGPIQHRWQNFSKLTGNRFHCHLKKGKPTYVAVWEVTNNEIRILEVTYAGTHENAPY